MKNKWVRTRHKIAFYIFKPLIMLYLAIKYRYRYKKLELEKNQPYLILSNHQTGDDQFMLNVAFNRPIYFVANSAIFSIRFISRIIQYLVAPIPKNKATKDISTIRHCMQVVKENGTLAIFPEGNTTFSGVTEHIDIAIAKLAKSLKIPVVLYNLTGGYKLKPRWAIRLRRSYMTGSVREIISKEEVENIPVEELYKRIVDGLYVDDQKSLANQEFKTGDRNAECLESLLYVCPNCGLTHFKSKGNNVTCLKCGYTQTYKADLTFEEGNKFRTVKEWYDYQNKYTASLNFNDINHVSDDEDVKLKEIFEHNKKEFDKGNIKLFNNRLIVNGIVFNFSDISGMSIFRHNRLDFVSNGRTYQVNGNKEFNAVKYLNFYIKFKNTIKGEEHDEFLGL